MRSKMKSAMDRTMRHEAIRRDLGRAADPQALPELAVVRMPSAEESYP